MSNELQFAKKHIRNRFCLMVLPQIHEGLWSVYENAKTICEKNSQIDQTIRTFQNLLTFIPKWDETRLAAEVERIQTASGCTYLEELLTATLITYLRAFAAVQYTQAPEIEVEFERPPLPRFIHELYKECARQCWTHAYLFKTYGVSAEQQARNRRELEQVLDGAMDTVLDSFLPWKSIVDKYFKEPSKEEVRAQAEAAVTGRGVSFTDDNEVKEIEPNSTDDEEDEDEEDTEDEKMVVSDETVELDAEELKDDSAVDDLVPTEEVVLNI